MFLKTKVNLGAVQVRISDSVKAAAVRGRGGEKSDFTLFKSTFLPSCQLSCCCLVHLRVEAVLLKCFRLQADLIRNKIKEV